MWSFNVFSNDIPDITCGGIKIGLIKNLESDLRII